MVCKNCLYSPICKVYADFGVTDVPYDEGDTCEMFKSKADVVEVVRCKKCRYYTADSDTQGACYMHHEIMRANEFCSYGEKTEGEENET